MQKLLTLISLTIQRIRQNKREPLILILMSFLITFASIRIITHMQKAHLLPNQTGVLHIHHLVPGIILLLLCGYVSIGFWHQYKLRSYLAIIFGIGAALTIDEFALWLFLEDVYWAKQGRDSVDAVIVTVIILSIVFIISEAHDHSKIRDIYWGKKKIK